MPILRISVSLQELMGKLGFSFSLLKHTVKRWPPAIQEESQESQETQDGDILLLDFQLSGLKNINSCCLSHTAYGILLWKPSKLGLTTLSKVF